MPREVLGRLLGKRISNNATLSSCQARWTHWYNSGITVMGVTNHFLVVFKTHFTAGNLCLVSKPGQYPVTGEVIIPTGGGEGSGIYYCCLDKRICAHQIIF